MLGVTEDVPPWGRSVHQGLMMAILRPTPPLSIHPTCHFAFCQCCHALPSLAAFFRPLTTPIPLSCLLAYNPAFSFTRNIASTTQSDLNLPLPYTAAHPPPSFSLAFSPSHQWGLPVSMPQNPSSIYLGKPTWKPTLFFPCSLLTGILLMGLK